MTSEEFVRACYNEKEETLKKYFSPELITHAGQLIESLSLSNNQETILKKLIDTVMTDSFITILYAIDGSASIDGIQQIYTLLDEEDNEISGELEGHAYDYFQKSKSL